MFELLKEGENLIGDLLDVLTNYYKRVYSY
jgi:hypothetical protein